MAKAKNKKLQTHESEFVERLVGVHGENHRSLISSFVVFWDTNRALWNIPDELLESVVKDIIFRISPSDLLEKYKEPRAPDYVLEAQEKVRQINHYIHEINRQADEIGKLIQENEQIRGKIGQPVRRHLPDTRQAITHKFNVGGHEGYMTVGLFENGDPGELFITMAKEGSTIGGLMDTIGTLTSISLQYGVNVETLAKKFTHQRFEPSGYTGNPEIKMASSIIDYVFRWIELHFVISRQVPKPAETAQPVAE